MPTGLCVKSPALHNAGTVVESRSLPYGELLQRPVYYTSDRPRIIWFFRHSMPPHNLVAAELKSKHY